LIFKYKTVLITGGTGSFGQAMTQYLLDNGAEKILIFSRDEFKQDVMCKKFNSDKLRFFIGDIRDKERLVRAMHGVDFVIHAAALKQVPACEYNPIEAIKTNVNGAMNVIDAAIDCKVQKVVALSTDKAVNPINLYGATKLCSDKLFVNANAYSGKVGTMFSVVRYGNVAGSRGSVMPYFEDLIKHGELVLPVTDIRMTRFYITLDQGIELVDTAFNKMQGGEIFIAKIPSFKITDYVEHLEKAFRVIGIRPGEKLHEIMITAEDSERVREFEKYYIIFADDKIRKIGKAVEPGFTYSSDNNREWLFV